MNKRLLLLTSLLLQIIGAKAQLRVYEAAKVPPDLIAQSGYQYTLPLTIMTVEIPVTKIEWMPVKGECLDKDLVRKRLKELGSEKYYKKLTDGDSVIIFKVGDIVLTNYSVADQAKKYWVTGRKRALKNQKIGLTLLPDGRLSGAQTTFQDKTLEIVSGVVKVAGSLVGFMRTTNAGVAPSPCSAKDDYDAVKKSIASLLKSGLGGASLAMQLAELRKIEASLLEELTFAETKTIYSVKRDVVIQPTDKIDSIPLFTLSPSTGLVIQYPQPMYPGSRWYTDHVQKNKDSNKNGNFTDDVLATATDKVAYTLRINKLSGQPDHATALPNENLFGIPLGFRYNRPALTRVDVQKAGSTILADNVYLPQLGRVGTLPVRLSEMQFTLDPATGALLTVSQTMASISPEAISGLSDSLTGLKPPKTTELQDLTEDASKMEQRVKLLKNQKEYEELIKAQTLPKE